jgi:hypothetical protein
MPVAGTGDLVNLPLLRLELQEERRLVVVCRLEQEPVGETVVGLAINHRRVAGLAGTQAMGATPQDLVAVLPLLVLAVAEGEGVLGTHLATRVLATCLVVVVAAAGWGC